jgi:hypothetical protein
MINLPLDVGTTLIEEWRNPALGIVQSCGEHIIWGLRLYASNQRLDENIPADIAEDDIVFNLSDGARTFLLRLQDEEHEHFAMALCGLRYRLPEFGPYNWLFKHSLSN